MRCFVYAFHGIRDAVRGERNLRIHLCAAFYVLCFGLGLGLEAAEWAAALLCVGLVISLELVNTALERLCDQVTTERSPNIRLAKDCAAGAVLWTAVISAVIGCVIFLPKLLALRRLTGRLLVLMAVCVAALPVWAYFIFRGRIHK